MLFSVPDVGPDAAPDAPALRGRSSPAPGRDALLTACRSIEWLRFAPENVSRRLLRNGRLVAARRHSTVCEHGAEPDRFFVLLDGHVGLWRPQPAVSAVDGVWLLLTDHRYATLGLDTVMASVTYPCALRVLSPRAELLELPAAALRLFLLEHPDAGADIATHLARRLHSVSEQALDKSVLDTGQLVAKYLLRLAGADGLTRPLTQTDMAARLGLSRQSVNASLSRFVRRGWMVRAGTARYRLLRADALGAYAGGPPRIDGEILH